MLREGDELVVAACAGHANRARAQRLPVKGSTSGEVLQRGRAQRVTDVAAEMRISPEGFGVTDAHTALLVPMMHRGTAIGVLVAFDHGRDAEEFSAEDETLLRSFAQSAANAVAIRRSVEADRLRSTIAAADAERAPVGARAPRRDAAGTRRTARFARLDSADAAMRTPRTLRSAKRSRTSSCEIANLRAIISDLRPSLLDDLGLLPAIEALLERRRDDTLADRSRTPPPAP